MAVLIGSKLESDFTDPLGLLSDCHRRIERFLNLLIVITEQAGGGALDGEQRQALEIALRYFQTAAPKHTLDEEESLFPRMRKAESRQAQEALAAVDALHSEHLMIETTHDEVNAAVSEWLEKGRLSGGKTDSLKQSLDVLQQTYQKHIAVEDEYIFPMAKQALSEEDLASIGKEMAGRRGVNLSARCS